jgi:isoamylase
MPHHALPERLAPGRPWPLGARWDGLGVNFAVFSAHAQRIDLCLFDPSGHREIARLPLPECTDEVWHGYLGDAQPGLLYGFRAYGPYQPLQGHRFNPHKLLLDPYARQLDGALRWSDALYGYRAHSARADLSVDRRDSAPFMPKCVVVDEHFDWSRDVKPRTGWPETILYETHVKGLSMLRDDVAAHQRGTFAALASPWFIDHLLRLGVSAVELMPIHAILQDRFLVERGLRNYWGYSTLSFFAPEPAYLSTGGLNELRVAVRRLHEAGIEVILDVVYNHTCEGDETGPTLSWRGLDNASYYRLAPEHPRGYVNDTGCGNTVNATHPRVLQMIMDSLRYWASSFNVDGFRFDLGVTLGREAGGFDPGAGFFDAIRQDPLLADRKLISEPWDVGHNGYQVGRHPPGWSEWNDRFRDGVRRFWRGDVHMRPDLAARLTGSADLFNHRARRPWASINYVASHDGFPLADVAAYEHKHNAANGESNRDGHGENCSANWGVEGPTDDPAILARRRRIARAMLATVFVSLGTPMLLAGDEFGRTQQGNNNAYCQDNPLSWIDWSLADSEEGRALSAFVGHLTHLRRAHPLLREARFLYGDREVLPGVTDIGWFDERGRPLDIPAWQDGEQRVLTCRRAGADAEGRLEVLLLFFNAGKADLSFVAPAPALEWNVLVDTAGDAHPGVPQRQRGQRTTVRAGSAVLLQALTHAVDDGASEQARRTTLPPDPNPKAH